MQPAKKPLSEKTPSSLAQIIMDDIKANPYRLAEFERYVIGQRYEISPLESKRRNTSKKNREKKSRE